MSMAVRPMLLRAMRLMPSSLNSTWMHSALPLGTRRARVRCESMTRHRDSVLSPPRRTANDCKHEHGVCSGGRAGCRGSTAVKKIPEHSRRLVEARVHGQRELVLPDMVRGRGAVREDRKASTRVLQSVRAAWR